MKYRPIIAVDFDGTITKKSTFPLKPTKEDLAPYAVETLKALHNMGCEIILWTCRSGKQIVDALTFCGEVGIPIDYANQPARQCYDSWGNFYESPKIFANYYIDDFNLGGFKGWLDAFNTIMKDPYFLEDDENGKPIS
jgi:hypothetical protein